MTRTPDSTSGAEHSAPLLPGSGNSRSGWIQRRLVLLVGLYFLVCAGCTVWQQLTPRQRWSDRWGPMVPHTTFPGECELCHYSDTWDKLKDDFTFDHLEETGHALTGAHEGAACLRCHNDRGPVEAYQSRGCAGCHADPHKSALGLDCTRCHNESWWEPDGLIAEHASTRFPLVGSHALAACENCHVRATVGDYRGAPVECHLCHQREALQAQPPHRINGWFRNCDDCHDPDDWYAVRFNHDIFPLLGGHAGLNCTDCHAGGRIVGTPNDCFSCHRQDYLNTPDHVANGLSTDCAQCHGTVSWNIP